VIVVGDGSIQITLVLFGKAAEVVSSGVFRIEINGAIEVSDGSVQIALGLFGIAPVVVGIGVFRIEFDGATGCGDGFVQIDPGVTNNTEFGSILTFRPARLVM